MSVRKLCRTSIAVALFGLTACGGDSPTAAPSVVGSFTLQTVNGQALPFTVLDASDSTGLFKLEIISPSSISIDQNGTFRFITTSRLTGNGTAPVVSADTTTGSYTLAARQLSLTALGSTIAAQWDGGAMITMTDPPYTLVFRR